MPLKHRQGHRIGGMKAGQQDRNNNYLIQFRVEMVPFTPCESPSHQSSPATNTAQSWHVRFYLNPQRMEALQAQHLEAGKINEILWNEACEEQDCVGPQVHFRRHLCSACVLQAFQGHSGTEALVLAMVMAQTTAGSFVIVAHRRTGLSAVIPLPATIPDEDILSTLRRNIAVPVDLNHAGGSKA